MESKNITQNAVLNHFNFITCLSIINILHFEKSVCTHSILFTCLCFVLLGNSRNISRRTETITPAAPDNIVLTFHCLNKLFL